jgi:hypothetical protein
MRLIAEPASPLMSCLKALSTAAIFALAIVARPVHAQPYPGDAAFLDSAKQLFEAMARLEAMKSELFSHAVPIPGANMEEAVSISGLSNSYRNQLLAAKRQFDQSPKALDDIRRFELKVFLYKPYYHTWVETAINAVAFHAGPFLKSLSIEKEIKFRETHAAAKALHSEMKTFVCDGSLLLSDEMDAFLDALKSSPTPRALAGTGESRSERMLPARDREALVRDLTAIKGTKKLVLAVAPDREASDIAGFLSGVFREAGFKLELRVLLTVGDVYGLEVLFKDKERTPAMVKPMAQALHNAGFTIKARLFPEWDEARVDEVQLAIGKPKK